MKLYGKLAWYRVCVCGDCNSPDSTKSGIRLARRSIRAKEKKQFKKDLMRW